MATTKTLVAWNTVKAFGRKVKNNLEETTQLGIDEVDKIRIQKEDEIIQLVMQYSEKEKQVKEIDNKIENHQPAVLKQQKIVDEIFQELEIEQKALYALLEEKDHYIIEKEEIQKEMQQLAERQLSLNDETKKMAHDIAKMRNQSPFRLDEDFFHPDNLAKNIRKVIIELFDNHSDKKEVSDIIDSLEDTIQFDFQFIKKQGELGGMYHFRVSKNNKINFMHKQFEENTIPPIIGSGVNKFEVAIDDFDEAEVLEVAIYALKNLLSIKCFLENQNKQK